MTAAEDLEGKVSDNTAGLKVLLQDSKYYAVDERVLSVSYAADKDIVGTVKAGETVQITATLPEVEKIDTRVSLSDNGKGGFAWRRIFCTAGGGDMLRMTNPTIIRLRCIRLSDNLLTGNLPEQVPAQKIS